MTLSLRGRSTCLTNLLNYGMVVGLILSTGCANYKMYRAEVPPPSPDATPTYTIYSVGDLGKNEELPAGILPQMVAELQKSGEQSTLVILGNLVGKTGLPPRDNDDRAVAEQLLNAKLDPLKDYAGQLYVVPGELDYGPDRRTKHLKRLSKYVDKYLDRDEVFLPEDECSGPDDVELTEDISLVGLNSAWYLNDWNKDREVNSGCEFLDRESFALAVADEINGLRDKTVVLAMHHPLESNGNRGGYYSAGQHIFPLRDGNPALWVPLPGIGSLIRVLQAGVGSTQDIAHPLYKSLVSSVKTGVESSRNLMVLSAHEHIQQFNSHRTYSAIVSGTGSTRGPSIRANDAEFVYGQLGYNRIDFYADGSVWTTFMALNEATGDMEEVYKTKMIEDRFAPMEDTQETVPATYEGPSEVSAPLYSEGKANRSGFYRALFGDHYRTLYYTPIVAPVAYLDTMRGGLTPFERGGGMQTMSLRLRDQNDRIWDMRSIRKNPSQLLPYPLDVSFAADVLRDQFTAAHPYGAYTVPRLSEALSLYYMKPGYAYVPKQPALKQFNDTYGNEIYMVQERPDDNWSTLANYGYSEEIIGTDDVLEEIQDSWKKQIDQKMYLRARLLDIVIGDWDRHMGQWRWTGEKDDSGEEEITLFKPIAKDRDQVFSNFDGLIMGFARFMAPPARKLKPFTGKLSDPKWSNINARWNDRLFLNRLTRADWEEAIQEVTSTLTDELLLAAINDLPDTIARVTLEDHDVWNKLKKRRDALPAYAERYYTFLADEVNVLGTNKDDYFQIDRLKNGDLHVRVYDADDDGDKDELYYDRVFRADETDEVIIYGLDGDDHFELEGEGRSRIRVRIIGGLDDDEFDADSGSGPTKVYDSPKGMEVKDQEGGATFRFTKVRDYNIYNFQEYKPSYAQVYPLFGFDPTDGFALGAGLLYVKHGFKRDPYAQQHTLSATYALRSMAAVAKYKGIFINTFGYHNDLMLDLLYRSPDYTYNYFGVGNETTREISDNERGFNLIRVEQIRVAPQWRVRFRNSATFQFGPAFEYGKVSRTSEGLDNAPDLIDDRAFLAQKFVGAEVNYHLNSLAIPAVPDRGLVFDVRAEYKKNLTSDDRQYFKVGSSLSYYLLLFKERVQLATRIGAEHLDGDFEFYQLPNLGGRTNLRGFTTERYYGNTIFFQNIDVRLRGFGFGKGTVPTTGGLLAGFDYGRVWHEGQESDTWHTSVGGGIWFAPLNAAILSATYFTSSDDSRITVGLGFPF